MRRSGFKLKPRKPLKRTPFKRSLKQLKRTKLSVVGHSETSEQKQEIQSLLLQIVILRDGGCILRGFYWHTCNGFANDGHLILQADHLITRSNSATFADSRLVVCVCKGAHGWKSVGSNARKSEYDEIVKSILPKERVDLWVKCERDSWRITSKMDWKLEIANLRQILKKLQNDILS